MRKYGKTDANQSEIVKALRAIGCTVQSLAAVGNGCPDILCARNGKNYLLEIKNGDLSPSEQRLTPQEEIWLHDWKAPVAVVHDVREAMIAVEATLQ